MTETDVASLRNISGAGGSLHSLERSRSPGEQADKVPVVGSLSRATGRVQGGVQGGVTASARRES